MVFFGHIGITVGIVHLYNRSKSKKSQIDLRLPALMAITPDLIDKPIGLIFHETFGHHTRLYAHSLLFAFLILIAFYLYRKRLVHPLILWLSFFGHLVLDRMWIFSREYLYWPLLGPPPPLARAVVLGWLQGAITPYNLFGEVVGALILLAVYLDQQHNSSKNLSDTERL